MPDRFVHIVDDDEAVRDAIGFLLQSDGLSVRLYESAVALVARFAALEPGCVVTDVRMPEMSGLELVRYLKDGDAPVTIVMITGHGDIPLAVEAMKAGVYDFIEKPFDDEILLGAVHAALRRSESKEQMAMERQTVIGRFETLSDREKDVFHGVVAGRANKLIAYDLGISPRTVEIHRANLMTKMKADSISALVRTALKFGLTD